MTKALNDWNIPHCRDLKNLVRLGVNVDTTLISNNFKDYTISATYKHTAKGYLQMQSLKDAQGLLKRRKHMIGMLVRTSKYIHEHFRFYLKAREFQ